VELSVGELDKIGLILYTFCLLLIRGLLQWKSRRPPGLCSVLEG